MSAPQLQAVPNNINEVPYQDASLDIWDTKYRLKTKTGEAVDTSIDDTFERVAKALSDVETTDELKKNGMRNSSGHYATVPFQPAALFPMPVRRNTNPLPQPLTAPYPAPLPILWMAFWKKYTKQA